MKFSPFLARSLRSSRLAVSKLVLVRFSQVLAHGIAVVVKVVVGVDSAEVKKGKGKEKEREGELVFATLETGADWLDMESPSPQESDFLRQAQKQVPSR